MAKILNCLKKILHNQGDEELWINNIDTLVIKDFDILDSIRNMFK